VRVGFYIHRLVVNEYHSVEVLLGVLKQHGHEAGLWIGNRGVRTIVPEIRAFRPELMCYSICSNEAETYLSVNRELRKHCSFVSLFGGPHPTFFPDFIREASVDIMCVGEGEEALVELIDRWTDERKWSVRNLHFQRPDGTIIANPVRPLIGDLDSLPFPDRESLFARSPLLGDLPIKTFFTGRGCPYNCSYCFNRKYNEMYRGLGRILRHKSVGYLFREIQDVGRRHPMSFIRFCDDNFGIDRGWLEEFSERYPREIGLPFSCYTRPNLVRDEYVRSLARAGCVSVYMGIECGNEAMRKRLLNRNLTDGEIVAASESLHRAGIKICALNMIGLPGETAADQDQLLALNWKCRSDYADVSVFQPFPGTDIYEHTRREELMAAPDQKRVSGQFGESVLAWPDWMNDRIKILSKVFGLMVDRPGLYGIFRRPALLRRLGFFQPLLNLFCKIYHGYFLQRRIFPARVPLAVRLRALQQMARFGRGETQG